MELGSWSLIQGPSLLALIPLVVMIALGFKGYHNAFANVCGIVVAALMMGQSLDDVADALQASLSSSVALIGVIIMMGAGLGTLMTETGVTKTVVYYVVKVIGVNSRTRAKLCLIVSSIVVCGLLGTLGGGNAIIAPILIPIMASLGITPTAVSILFKTAGEAGLVLGPLTGVTLITLEVTGLSYGEFMLQAAIPFCFFWLLGAWIGSNRAQKRTEGRESYSLSETIDLESVEISLKEKTCTAAFLVTLLALIVYGIIFKASTQYALVVMLILEIVIAAVSRIGIQPATKAVLKGFSSQGGMFLVFLTIDTLLNYVELGGGFEELSAILGGLAGDNPSAVMLVSSIVGGFGIEAAAIAEISIIAGMFGELAARVGLPMGCFAVSILAATRLTTSLYPTPNVVGQMGTAHCENLKENLQGLWCSAFCALVFVIVYAFVGPIILG